VNRLMLGARGQGGFALDLPDELVALFREDFYRIGRQQLIVAERGGDGATMFVVFEPGLDVVTAVSGGLEAVDPDDLVARQTRGKRDLGIAALELGLALRKPWDEFEFLA